jgi:hypothetical protein
MEEADVQQILESVESDGGAFDMHWSQAPTDHEVIDGQLVVLVEHTRYSDRGGGCQYGCSLRLYDSSSDQIASTEEYVWRNRTDPSKDDPRNRFSEILELDDMRALVDTPEGERWIPLDSEG